MLRKAESPARKMKVGAQKCVIQRVTNSAGSITSRGYEAASAKKVARMIQGHECHDEFRAGRLWKRSVRHGRRVRPRESAGLQPALRYFQVASRGLFLASLDAPSPCAIVCAPMRVTKSKAGCRLRAHPTLYTFVRWSEPVVHVLGSY